MGVVYVMPAIAAFVAATLMGAALFSRRPTRQLVFFGMLNLGTFLWASSYFSSFTIPPLFGDAARPAVAQTAFLVSQIGVAITVVYWFLFAAETTGARAWTSGRRFLLAHVPGVLLIAGAVFDRFHHSFITQTLPDTTYGPWGLAVLVMLYALIAAGCVMYLRAARRDAEPSAEVCYTLALAGLAALAVDVVWNVRGLIGLRLPYDPSVLALPFLSIAIAFLTMRSGLLDVVTAAEGQAFHGMADGGIVLSDKGRIEAVNDAARRMLPVLRRGHLLADDAPDLAAAVERLAEGYTDVPHGQQAWWVRVAPMRSPGGRSLGMLVLLTDLAEKRAFEERIVELNRDLQRTVLELEAATRAKDRFIASASHELRTPLQSVIGYTQRLLFERVGRLNKAQRDELEIVERSAKHLLAVIESLLDIAHLETGEIAVVDSVFDPHVVVRQVLDTLEPLASAKGLELRGVYEGPEFVRTDETKVRQVLLNLAGNAVKFTASGSVTVECVRHDGAGVRFRVRDTGPGIPSAEVERIFEAFHRVLDPAIENAGSGLGLYVSQVLVGMMGGSIAVDSVPGSGTTFTVTLPKASVGVEVPA